MVSALSTQLAQLDAVGLAAAIAAHDVSADEVLDSTLERLDAVNGDVNAVIHDHRGNARSVLATGVPAGPFAGVPMLMKDLWACEAGRPHHQGVAALKSHGSVADRDSYLVEAYRSAGFVSFGRTNTPELGAAATTEPLAYGPTRNPWNREHGPGGSSGGSAAAVAAGVLPAANASDGGGSIRIPAALCGLVGLKPSRGRMSMGPYMDEWGNSVQHVVCHTVRDSAAILDATHGPRPGDGVIAPPPTAPYAELARQDVGSLRIGFLDTAIRTNTEIDDDVRAAVREVATRLDGLGHRVEPSAPAALLDESRITAWGPAFAASTAASVAAIAAEIGRDLDDRDVEPWTRFIAERASQFAPGAVIAAQRAMMTFRRDTAAWWADDGFDLLLTPTCLRPAPRLGEMAPNNPDLMGVQLTTLHYSQLTQPFNVTGQPAVSLPLAMSRAGLPIGLQFVAAYGREDLLVQLAAQLEADMPWAERRAPLHP
ncbi:MAG: amidase [Actinomycetota bacterium]